MTGYQLLGAAIFAAIFAGFYTMTATATGWRVAAAIWGASVAVAALILVAALLLHGVIP